jgi:hypothetical protein
MIGSRYVGGTVRTRLPRAAKCDFAGWSLVLPHHAGHAVMLTVSSAAGWDAGPGVGGSSQQRRRQRGAEDQQQQNGRETLHRLRAITTDGSFFVKPHVIAQFANDPRGSVGTPAMWERMVSGSRSPSRRKKTRPGGDGDQQRENRQVEEQRDVHSNPYHPSETLQHKLQTRSTTIRRRQPVTMAPPIIAAEATKDPAGCFCLLGLRQSKKYCVCIMYW